MSYSDLPIELKNLIRAHAAASVLQTQWKRREFGRHTRRSEWSSVRERLCRMDKNAFGTLTRYSQVRREWRQEPTSWRHTSKETLSVIQNECLHGWWGTET